MSEQEAREAFHAALLEDDAELLYERAPCGYLSTTPDGVITKVNQTFLTLTGYTREELVGRRTFAQLLSAGGRIYHETHYAPLLRMQGSASGIALDIVRADRTRLPVLVNSVLDRDPDNRPTVVRTAVFDATQRREYERELLRARQRAEESEVRARKLAQTLQETLIPPVPPRVPDLDVAAVYRPAGLGDEVGGDFYDVFQTGAGEWFVAIGDVCGKGAAAASVTALARYTLRAAAARDPSPTRALEVLNESLLSDDRLRFCTVLLLRLRHHDDGWHVLGSTGGHPLPVVLRAGRPPQAVGVPGALAGVFPEPRFSEMTIELARGDALVIYTDGVVEGRHGNEFYGSERLRESLARHAGSAASLAEGVLQDVMDFQGQLPRDDIAVVALQVP